MRVKLFNFHKWKLLFSEGKGAQKCDTYRNSIDEGLSLSICLFVCCFLLTDIWHFYQYLSFCFMSYQVPCICKAVVPIYSYFLHTARIVNDNVQQQYNLYS